MNIRNRIIELRTLTPDEVRPNPRNWRSHPQNQRDALRGVLADVGIAGAVIAYHSARENNQLVLIDGHERMTVGAPFPALILDVTDAEADVLLTTYDPLGAMAETNAAQLDALLREVTTGESAVQAMLDDLATRAGIVPGIGGDTQDIDPGDAGDVPDLLAPFPYFGGKARVASRIWARFGSVQNYVEPFCGSAAVLLAAPSVPNIVTLNDADGFIANFWRAVAADPDAVAEHLDWPVNEIDLFSRHVALIRQSNELRTRLETDPAYYDANVAGWWCWGACAWIGTGWCSGDGPWAVEDGAVVNNGPRSGGVRSKLPHLGNAGQGVNRQLPHLGDAGQGVNRQLPHLGNAGQGVCDVISEHLRGYMGALRDALRTARVTCGDWARVVTPSVTTRHGLTAVLLDPPYGEGAQEYAAGGNHDTAIARAVWDWALANGHDPDLRIAVCGYDDGRDVPPDWTAMRWTARKGYQADGTESADNPTREVVYFSPHCQRAE